MNKKTLAKIAAGVTTLGLAAVLTGCNSGKGGGGPLGGGPGAGGPGAGGPGAQTFTQRERLARPLVNEGLATFDVNPDVPSGMRHEVNNTIPPSQDPAQLRRDILDFLTDPQAANRDNASATTIANILVPDVMVVDLSKAGPAGYLGAETTNGFGGRKLEDDVVDTTLMVVFGNNIIPHPNPIPSLTTDNIGPGVRNFPATFPYLAQPN